MAQEQRPKILDDFKYAGFGELLNDAWLQQKASGIKEIKLPYYETFPNLFNATVEDRIAYNVNAKAGEKHDFYNGFEAIIVKDMPVAPQLNGLSLQDLEHRLQTPPQPYHPAYGHAADYTMAREHYDKRIIADMGQLYNENQDLFFKVTALYQPVVIPLLKEEHREAVLHVIKSTMNGTVRKQWFPADMNITRVEAANLLANINDQRAVYKTYFLENKDEAAGLERAPAADLPARQEREKYGQWILLDYTKDPTQHGNRVFQTYHDNWGFDLRSDLRRFMWVGIHTDGQIDALAKLLEKGHLVQLTPVDQTKTQTMYVFANPEGKTITLLDENGQHLYHDRYLTQEAKEKRHTRTQGDDGLPFRVASRAATPGQQAPSTGAEDEKKNRSRTQDDDKKPGLRP